MSVWIGSPPSACDLCQTLIVDVFYDARMPSYAGSWANVCEACFTSDGCTLGVGAGQRYQRTTVTQWTCTAGGRDSGSKRHSPCDC